MQIRRAHKHTLTRLHHLLSRSLPSHKTHLKDTDAIQLDPYAFAEAIIEAIHEPIIILDKELTIISVNKALLKTFKLTKKQIFEKQLASLIDQNPKEIELVEKLREMTMQKISFEEYELTHTFAKIGLRTVLINAKRIELGKLATDFLLLSIQDITKRKIIEQQKDDFVGYVTHELKTPITTVVAFVQILQKYIEKTGDQKSQFLLSKIVSQMARLTSRLNSFANVYKAQTGKLDLKKSKFNLNTLIEDVVESFQYMSNTHTITISGAATKPIYADKDRLHEVLSNLIMNAIKYSPNTNKIKIKIEEVPNEIIVHVKDYGLGINRDEQQKVFERFFRVKGKMENKIEGLGLGLYLVAAIIKEHKGKLWVESEEGKGSIFSFSLPIRKA